MIPTKYNTTKTLELAKLAETLPKLVSSTTAPLRNLKKSTSEATCRILLLPTELLIRIFVFAQNPALPTVCHQFWDLGTSSSVRAQYLMQIYGPTNVFSSRSMKRKIVTLSVVEQLLRINNCYSGDDDDWLFTRACELNEVELVTWIVDAALQQHNEAERGRLLTHFVNLAAIKGSICIIDLLVEKYDATNTNQALSVACQQNQVETVKHLVTKYGCNVHTENERHLRNASLNGYRDLVEFLIVGADVHAFNDAALQNACYKGHSAIVKLLLEAGANAQVQDNACIQHVIKNADINSLKSLIQHGVDSRCHHDWPLKQSCRFGLDEIVGYLLDMIGPVAVDLENGMLLEECIKSSRVSTIQLLLDHGANPNNEGVSRGLIYAVDVKTRTRNKDVMIKLLLDAGLDLNSQPKDVCQVLIPAVSSSLATRKEKNAPNL